MSIPRSVPATQPSEEKTHSGDEAGPVIGEYDDTGTVIREYIWLDDRPVAMLENGNVYYIHADHLNTPQVVTDDTQTVAWKGDYTPFGEVEEVVSTIDMPLRFPGQYADQETGLNYNYFRSYDPATGRYTQSDPIGLFGGVNSFSYVLNNPVRLSDTYGLATDQQNGLPIKNPAPGAPSDKTCLKDGENCNDAYQRGLKKCYAKRGINHPSVQSCRVEWSAWFEDCAMFGGKPCNEKNQLCGGTMDYLNRDSFDF